MRKNKTAVDGKGKDLIEMEEAIKLLNTSRPTFYRWVRSGKIKGMKVGRQWRFYKEDIERFLKGEAPRIELTADIKPLIKELEKHIKELGGKVPATDPKGGVEEAVTLMIVLGVVLKASDIHLTPYIDMTKAGNQVVMRYRLNGVLKEFARFDIRLLAAVIARWKTLASCNIHETKKPQDGKIITDFLPKQLDLRVSFLPVFQEEAVTARILDSSAVAAHFRLEELSFEPDIVKTLKRALQIPHGMIVVSGPTGSGKSTTLYACLNKLAKPEIKTMSVEDPVEYILPWVTQVQVDPRTGVNFEYYVRAILRSDPDVILIGEIRNQETLTMAQQCALTGHVVLTVLHADEAAASLLRMKEMSGNAMVTADSTKFLVAQRLVRKLCPLCSEKEKLKTAQMNHISNMAYKGNTGFKGLANDFKKPVGCPKCNNTGYKGRAPLNEILEVTPEIGRALRENAGTTEIRELAIRQGMVTMLSQGIAKAARGETTLDEIMRVMGVNLEPGK